MKKVLALIISIVLALTICGAAAEGAKTEIVVFAAASLTESLTEIKTLYGLAFDTGLSSAEIAEEFIRMTISGDDDTVDTIKGILLPSRAIYEKYT